MNKMVKPILLAIFFVSWILVEYQEPRDIDVCNITEYVINKTANCIVQ